MASRSLFNFGSPRVNGFDEVARPFLIGVGGGTASGKSSVCAKIMQQLGEDTVDHKQRRVIIISQDCFYKELGEEDKAKAYKGLFNFDHPDAFDDELSLQVLRDIKAGKSVNIPEYDYLNHQRKATNDSRTLHPADVILFEGILVFYFPKLRELFNMKLFVDTDADTRLSRRVMRDIKERGRDLEKVLTQYTNFVKPAFEEFCLPTKKYADVIIPRGADNTVAIDLIVQHIQELLRPNRNRLIKRNRHNSDSVCIHPPARPH